MPESFESSTESWENALIFPAGVIRPICELAVPVNQRLPSGPAVIASSQRRSSGGTRNVVIETDGVMRPIRLLSRLVNQTLPSARAVMAVPPCVAREPDVPVGAGGDRVGDVDVEAGTREDGGSAGGRDAPDRVAHREPEVAVGPGGDPTQQRHVVTVDRERRDLSGGCDPPDAIVVEAHEPDVAVGPGRDAQRV